MKKLAFIGLGNMGKAIAAGLVKSGAIAPENVWGYDPYTEGLNAFCKETGINGCASAQEAIAHADTVLIAVKPYVIESVLAGIKEDLRGKALISIALGYNYDRLAPLVDESTRVQFVMPNTPAMVNAGVLVFEQKYSLLDDERSEIMDLFKNIGVVEQLPPHLMGIAGCISGCGPAFAAMVIEALADAGVKYGLPRPTAYRLASQMIAGTGKMQLETGMHPGVIKDAVCSPGGSTILGVEALEHSGLRSAMLSAIEATMNYGK